MENQLFGRPQRPKGANIKQALKFMLVLASCAWLVYQTKHSIWNKTENCLAEIKLVIRDEDISLGRKGIALRFYERAFPDSGNVDSSAEVSSDGAKKDQDEEEFRYNSEILRENEGEKVEVESEKVSSKNKQKNSSKESQRSEPNDREYGSDKYQNRPVIDDRQSDVKEGEIQRSKPQNDVQKNAESDSSRKESMAESAADGGMTEGIEEVQPFQDVNGVPPDCNETEIVDGQAQSMYEENISDFRKGSKLEKSNIIKVASGEDNNVEVNLEGAKNDATSYEESNTGTITYVDASGINPQLRYQLKR